MFCYYYVKHLYEVLHPEGWLLTKYQEITVRATSWVLGHM